MDHTIHGVKESTGLSDFPFMLVLNKACSQGKVIKQNLTDLGEGE